MAIWQYTIDYFEKDSTEKRFPKIPTSLSIEKWKKISEHLEFSKPSLDELLDYIEDTAVKFFAMKRVQTWHVDIIKFENDNYDDIKIHSSLENGKLSYSICFRIRASVIERKHLEFAIELGKYLNAYMYDFVNIFPPDLHTLIEDLKLTSTYKTFNDSNTVLIDYYNQE